MERVRTEGTVLTLHGGVIGVYAPDLAMKVDKANSDGLKVAESLVDLLGIRKGREAVDWREVRSLLTEQSGKLTNPDVLRSLYRRMSRHLEEHAGVDCDATNLTWQAVSRGLIPIAIDGLDAKGVRAVIARQELRFWIQLKQRIPLWRRLPDFLRAHAETRAIKKNIRDRIAAGEVRDDFVQSLVGLIDRIGIDRVTYLVTVQLIAIAGVPGMMSACLLYAMTQHPQWRDLVRQEMRALTEDEVYALPVRKVPGTMRFIKEAMRMYSTPFVTRRVASRDISVDGVEIKEGQMYEISSYVQHHSEEYWENPQVFDPDRWLSSRRSSAGGAYVPFGFAPRSCVGASVGHAQLLLFCALVSRDFDFEISSDRVPSVRQDGFAVPTNFHGVFRKAISS